jgi:acyl-CoA-binding protein
MVRREFETACAGVKTLGDVDPERLLVMYGLYKQATLGDVQGARPGVLDLRAQAKYDAWAAWRGLSSDEAMARYVDIFRELSALV